MAEAVSAPPPGAVVRVGGNTTEATTTSTTAVDLLSVAGLSIGATSPFQLVGNYRKTTGAAAQAVLGLKCNTTVICETTAQGVANTSPNNVAANGAYEVLITPRLTNYVRGGTGTFCAYATAQDSNGASFPVDTADIPIATITDVVVRGVALSALVTLGVNEIHIYALATS